MKKNEIAILKAQLLKKLYRRANWGGSHTAFDDLPKSFPKHHRGVIKELAEELIKEELLLSKPTSYGRQVSLNPQKKADIEKIIKNVLGE